MGTYPWSYEWRINIPTPETALTLLAKARSRDHIMEKTIQLITHNSVHKLLIQFSTKHIQSSACCDRSVSTLSPSQLLIPSLTATGHLHVTHTRPLYTLRSASRRETTSVLESSTPGPWSCSLLLFLFQSTPSSSADKSSSLLSALTSVRSITQPTLHRLPRLHSSSSS
jgi:hypothetical protein